MHPSLPFRAAIRVIDDKCKCNSVVLPPLVSVQPGKRDLISGNVPLAGDGERYFHLLRTDIVPVKHRPFAGQTEIEQHPVKPELDRIPLPEQSGVGFRRVNVVGHFGEKQQMFRCKAERQQSSAAGRG